MYLVLVTFHEPNAQQRHCSSTVMMLTTTLTVMMINDGRRSLVVHLYVGFIHSFPGSELVSFVTLYRVAGHDE